MAESKRDEGEELQVAYSRVERFLNENSKAVSIGIGVIVLLLMAFLYAKMKYLPEQENKAQAEIFPAQDLFARDSFKTALMGNIEVTGFEEIINDYKWTKAANLSRYYAGICNLNLGNYSQAVSQLKKYSPKDPVSGAIRLSAMGDACMEMGKTDKGLGYYKRAAFFSDDDFTAPIMLMKAGQAYLTQGKGKEAKRFFEKIKQDYPKSQEGVNVDRYIAQSSN